MLKTEKTLEIFESISFFDKTLKFLWKPNFNGLLVFAEHLATLWLMQPLTVAYKYTVLNVTFCAFSCKILDYFIYLYNFCLISTLNYKNSSI